MSSHHVIRDEQEPPVIVLDDDFRIATLEELLGWAPMLIVEVDLLKWFRARKIKVDGILVPSDDLNHHVIDPGLKIYTYKKSILTYVLHKIAEEKDFTGLNIFCKEDLKIQLVDQIINGEHFKVPVSIFSEDHKTILSNHTTFKKWYPKGQKLLFDDSEIKVNLDLFEKDGELLITKTESVIQFEVNKAPFILTEF